MKCIFYLLFTFSTITCAATHKPLPFLQHIAGKPNEGEQIVTHYCVTCHGTKPLISLGAPPIHDNNAWNLRIKQGFDQLFKHTDLGFNAMPARGGCFECSDQQLMLAILALLPETGKKDLIKELKDSKKYNELKKII